MKNLISYFIVLVVLVSFNVKELHSQDKELNFLLEMNERSFNELKVRSGEEGIRPVDLGAWIANNTEVFLDLGADGQSGDERALYSVFIVGENGIVGQNGIVLRASQRSGSGRVEFSSVRNHSAEIQRTFDGLFAFDAFHPVELFDAASPGLFINSSREAERVAMDVGTRARGGGAGKVSVVIMSTAEGDRYENPVNPGIFVLTGDI